AEARGVPADVLAVVDEIRELDRLRARRRVREMLAVERLARRAIAVMRTADVGQRIDELAHAGSERPADFLDGDGRVLDDVVEPRGGDRLAIPGDPGDDLRHAAQMLLVRLP